MLYKFPVYKPYLPKEVTKYAHEALDSTWISSTGYYMDKAKEALEEYLGVKHVLLTSNGTTALHLVAKCLRKKYPNVKTILVPNSVYVASWNALLYDRYFNLRNTDTDLKTWNFDEESYNKLLYSTQAILVTHNLGNPVNVPQLKREHPEMIFIEDACEGFFGTYESKPVGTESFCSAFSFYANKNITTGEGGAFVTNDDDAYEYAKLLWSQAQVKRFIHSELGYNYRMTNIEAALLYGQLKIANQINAEKYRVFFTYQDNLIPLKGKIEFQKQILNTRHSCWMFGIRIIGNESYEKAKEYFDSYGIETRPFFSPINSHGHLRGSWNNMTNANLLYKEVVIFPSYPELKQGEINIICERIKRYAERTI